MFHLIRVQTASSLTVTPATSKSCHRKMTTLNNDSHFQKLGCSNPTLDVLVLVIFCLSATTRWTSYVAVEYLIPQLQAASWTEARKEEEITYYSRSCSREDVSATHPFELVLSSEASSEEFREHQLKHGFSYISDVISPETAAKLRQYIDSRNRNLTDQESIYLIQGDNRFSFLFGTEETSVRNALVEIGTHKQLGKALTAILGADPAMIELTAISSSYGAIDQKWHDDVVRYGSASRYARTFGPSYSVFIQLQNSTTPMGVSGACPGTHYCSDGDMVPVCLEHGLHVVGNEGHWGVGDAMIMNMNAFHRGSAHTDPNAPDRIMLIVTFVPQPNGKAEPRMMSQGITYSMRWDLWGHTLNDLANAHTVMIQPWTTLRSLGLYKLPGTAWGVDYISSSTQRIANVETGFSRSDLQDTIALGGIRALPSFLQGQVYTDDDSWSEYLMDCVQKCRHFFEKAAAVVSFAYILFYAVRGGKERHRVTLKHVVLRLAVMAAMVWATYLLAVNHVSTTNWAIDIKNNLRYTSVMDEEDTFIKYGLTPHVKSDTTLPTRYDVLVDRRYGSTSLAMYRDFIRGHPGNRQFNHVLRSSTAAYLHQPATFRFATVVQVYNHMYNSHRARFLKQGTKGNWHVMPKSEVVTYIASSLITLQNPVLGAVREELRNLRDQNRYGRFRRTSWAPYHNEPMLDSLDKRLLGIHYVPAPQAKARPQKKGRPVALPGTFSRRIHSIEKSSQKIKSHPAQPLSRRRARSAFPPPVTVEEPYAGAWIKTGTEVEIQYQGYWYYGIVEHVSPHGKYTVSCPPSDVARVYRDSIRNFHPYVVGEPVEITLSDDWLNEVYPCVVVTVLESSDEYMVRCEDGDEARLHAVSLRRVAETVESYVYQPAY